MNLKAMEKKASSFGAGPRVNAEAAATACCVPCSTRYRAALVAVTTWQGRQAINEQLYRSKNYKHSKCLMENKCRHEIEAPTGTFKKTLPQLIPKSAEVDVSSLKVSWLRRKCWAKASFKMRELNSQWWPPLVRRHWGIKPGRDSVGSFCKLYCLRCADKVF